MAPSNFTLHTDGNKLLGQDGNSIWIKGFARPSLEWSSTGQYLSVTDIENMKAFGANAIRLDLNASYWNSSQDESVAGSYRQIINAIVSVATKNNMLVILDYHWATSSGAGKMAPAGSTTTSFWSSVAQEYASFGNVLFELFNEPNGISDDQWLSGDSSWEGMQQMFDLVRTYAPNNILIIGGLDWGYDLSFLGADLKNCGSNKKTCFVLESDGSLAKNVMYGTHPYKTPNGSYKVDDFVDNISGVKDLYPIVLTEFGDNNSKDYTTPFSSSNASAAYKTILEYVNEYGLHYTGFAWWIEGDQPSFPALIQGSWSNPSCLNGGCYIQSDFQNSPGTQFSFSQ